MSDAFPGVRAVATPTVAESMRTVAPQDHSTYAPVCTATTSPRTIVDSQFGLAPPFEVEDRVVVLKPP
jgi:hypothetical protein